MLDKKVEESGAIDLKNMGCVIDRFTLPNNMNVLVRSVHTIPKVSLQIWYGVGSKDESTGEKGIAHLIEHMIFKGTEKLSESDIKVITHMLSGSCNAFTSYDYTGYLFNFPAHHWAESLPIMADCMRNCTFKDDMLNSEMKAVIQELKMYKDQHIHALIYEMMAAIFSGHPYGYPVIGFKQDLWDASGDRLRNFYNKHYVPNNATLVVVGDVDKDEVFSLAGKHFGHIKADSSYTKKEFYYSQDIVAKSICLYRDINQPIVLFAFTVPGIKTEGDYTLQLLQYVLGRGRGSRLYKKLVNELRVATSVDVDYFDLFDHALMFVICEPKDVCSIQKIETIIHGELVDIVEHGFKDFEVSRAIKKSQSDLCSLLEDIERQAYEIGKYFLATGDENTIFNSMQSDSNELKEKMEHIVKHYLRASIMHKGVLLPLSEKERVYWSALQKASDAEDEKILSVRSRTTEIEPPSFAKNITVKEPEQFTFPKPSMYNASNGIKVLYYHNPAVPKVTVRLDFKVRHYFDPEDQQGLLNFISFMLLEGTEKYTAEEFADLIESHGMSLRSYPGGISMSMLKDDLPLGLEILNEVVARALFDEKEIEKVKMRILAEIKQFWDEPHDFAGQLIQEHLYQGHPYSKSLFGSRQFIENVSGDQLVDFYKKCITPKESRLAIVGDIKTYDIEKLIKDYLEKWDGPTVADMQFSPLKQVADMDMQYFINRDQVVLCFAQLSVSRNHEDYDKLLLFDQIFGSGVLGSMNSRLFQLREQSGLFYTISGTFLAYANEQPGMFFVKTVVSLDRLQEAKDAIETTIMHAVDTLIEEELDEAKRAVINSLVDSFADNSGIASVFLYLDRLQLPQDFLDTRAENLLKISVDQVKDAVKRVIGKGEFFVLEVGRVGKPKIAGKL